MGSFSVVVLTPILNHDPRFTQVEQNLPRQALVAKATVKALNIAILPGTPGIDVDRLDVIIS